MTACNGEIVPIVVERPCVERVGCGVFPEEGVGAIDVGSSEGLPTGANSVIDLSAVSGIDSNRVAAVDGDGEETSA